MGLPEEPSKENVNDEKIEKESEKLKTDFNKYSSENYYKTIGESVLEKDKFLKLYKEELINIDDKEASFWKESLKSAIDDKGIEIMDVSKKDQSYDSTNYFKKGAKFDRIFIKEGLSEAKKLGEDIAERARVLSKVVTKDNSVSKEKDSDLLF